MNTELLKDLAEQAGIPLKSAYLHFGIGLAVVGTDELKRFAEVIITRCADFVDAKNAEFDSRYPTVTGDEIWEAFSNTHNHDH